eukprot:scaffold618_cov130-Cylindrotheca_fusiformis.AAC.33
MTSNEISPTAAVPMMSLPIIDREPPSPETLPQMVMNTRCFAVQYCAQLQGPAIFWRWEDACHYVNPSINQLRPAIFQQCDSVFQAIEYMVGTNEEYVKALSQALTANSNSSNNNRNKCVQSEATEKRKGCGPVSKEKERRQAFKANIRKLREYKEIYGSYHVVESPNNPMVSILTFYNRMRRQARKYKTDPSTCTLHEEEIETLKSIGFLDELDKKAPAKTSLANMSTLRFRKQWDTQFEKVKKFTKEHDRLPTESDDPLMYGWVSRQRRKMREGVEKAEQNNSDSKLTNQQMLKLASVGISFTPAIRNVSFDERVDQWIQYRREHGKNPLARTELGQFQHRVITVYRKFKLGEISQMNIAPEILKKLQDCGFPFPTDDDLRAFVEKREQDKGKRRLTWDESYQKLFDFKKRHGHLVVPRNEPQLGGWAHSQRKEYARMKRGQKTFLTQERLAKLVDIGFAFSNANWREITSNATRNEEQDGDEESDGGDDDHARIPNQGLRHLQHQQQNLHQPQRRDESVLPRTNDDAASLYAFLQLSNRGGDA